MTKINKKTSFMNECANATFENSIALKWFCVDFVFQPLPTTTSPSTPSTTTSKSSISARSTGSAEHRSKKKASGDKQISSWKLFRRTQSLGKLF